MGKHSHRNYGFNTKALITAKVLPDGPFIMGISMMWKLWFIMQLAGWVR